MRGCKNQGHALLEGLTSEQCQAVTHGHGPLLIQAGPGSGKTRVLATRIAFLLATKATQPAEILAVSFSVRAADELKTRLRDMLGVERAGGVRATTLHSLCARLLRENVAWFRDTSIYDQLETQRAIDWLVSKKQRGEILAGLSHHGIAANEIEREITAAKNRLITADEYERRAGNETEKLVAGVWRLLDDEMVERNAVTFTDLLVSAIDLLATRPYLLEEQRAKARWLLVDEVQDLNPAQLELVCLLGAPDGNVTVVGDPDQVVFGFQGADAAGMRRLADRFPGYARATLRRNYRSREEILTAASRCIAQNLDRDPKALIAQRGPGGSATVHVFGDEQAEASWVVHQVRRALGAGFTPEEILILCRKVMQVTRPVRHTLNLAGIPHRMIGELGLYELAPVRAALAHMALLSNPLDVEAFTHAIRTPKRGIGSHTISRIVAIAREEHDGDLIAACANRRARNSARSSEAEKNLADFANALTTARKELAAGERSLTNITSMALTMRGGIVTGYQHVRDHDQDANKRHAAVGVLEDLRSLLRHIQSYEQQETGATLPGFLEIVAGLGLQQIEPGQRDRRVTISSIHRAKGGEARLVILIGCEEGVLPAWQAAESGDAREIEEERRLFYVAATRAKDILACSHVQQRHGRPTSGPSRFLLEAGLIEAEAASAA